MEGESLGITIHPLQAEMEGALDASLCPPPSEESSSCPPLLCCPPFLPMEHLCSSQPAADLNRPMSLSFCVASPPLTSSAPLLSVPYTL